MGESWSLPSVQRTISSGEEPNRVTPGRLMKNMYGEGLMLRMRRYSVKASPWNSAEAWEESTTWMASPLCSSSLICSTPFM